MLPSSHFHVFMIILLSCAYEISCAGVELQLKLSARQENDILFKVLKDKPH